MQPGRHSRPLPLPRSQSAPRLLPCPPQVEMVERPHTPLAIASRRTPSTHSLDQFDELLEEGEADIAVYVEPPELESGFQPTITVICRNIRDKALREIDSYQFLSRQDEHEYWEDVRDHTRFYPLTVFSVQACLASTRALLDSPHSHHERP
ncbi:hypothetical protein BD410DRAFT_310183 [Rickenella mellea]|uniref:Uncharacterized protein n=1 Tax=Rickenella mellea TaxID=50990 RepID=A0A4Y7Q1G3_9AGAM|nr:hypothetical protein BD410DRAFT_310183 [Rickenella mellea]